MSFQLAKPIGQAIGRVIELDAAAAQSFEEGAPLVISSGKFAEVTGADPATMTAIALHPVGTGSGSLYPIGSKEFPAGKIQAVPLRPEDEFTALYSGTLPTTVGGSYGIVRDTDNKWKVDFSDTVNTRVKLTDIRQTAAPLSQKRVTVVFLASAITPI